MKYTKTINLPKTSFPMRANLPRLEPKILQGWKKADLYQRIRDNRKGRKKYILHDGPPYANGNIHLGHVVNKVLKDFILKDRNLKGLDTPFVPGWDCHGLPIEHKIETELTIDSKKSISPMEFRARCRKFAKNQVKAQMKSFVRLGVVGDWEHPYLSMTKLMEANILRSFAEIFRKGYIKKGVKPVHWCLDCASSLAEAEVEYLTKKSVAVTVGFQIFNPGVWEQCLRWNFQGKDTRVLIWTTTPWTLAANQAVAAAPDASYTLIEVGDRLFFVASELVSVAQECYGWEQGRQVFECKGSDMQGLFLHHCWQDRKVPVVTSTHVNMFEGTGFVHISPAHGVDDFLVGKAFDLKVHTCVGTDGRFHAEEHQLDKKQVLQVDQAVLEILRGAGSLIHHMDYSHSYPHCWRHHSPIIFLATQQWFIHLSGSELTTKCIHAAKEVDWYPGWGFERFRGLLEGRPDWCISRQRLWGVPLALFLHKEDASLHPDTPALLEKVALGIEREGIDYWDSLQIDDLLLREDAKHYYKNKDVLDVWFDSGVTHRCVLDANADLSTPADLYLEGTDQHRGWFSSSLITSVATRGSPPFKKVLTHSFVVDQNGAKMSKSMGNVVDPESIVQTFGADILRLWVCATDFRCEMTISKNILQQIADGYRRIRNTCRFLLSNLWDFSPEVHLLEKEQLLGFDKWVLTYTANLQKTILEHYEYFGFHNVYQKIHQYCANILGSVYLDIIKDRLYTMPTTSAGRRSAQTTLYHILQAVSRWIAPVLSFTAEDIYRSIPSHGLKQESVFLEEYYTEIEPFADVSADAFGVWEKTLEVRSLVIKQIEKYREQRNAGGSSLDVAVTLFCKKNVKEILEKLRGEVKFVFIVSQVVLADFDERPCDLPLVSKNLCVKITPAEGEKCERCWHYAKTVEASSGQKICARCVLNIEGRGEVRKYV